MAAAASSSCAVSTLRLPTRRPAASCALDATDAARTPGAAAASRARARFLMAAARSRPESSHCSKSCAMRPCALPDAGGGRWMGGGGHVTGPMLLVPCERSRVSYTGVSSRVCDAASSITALVNTMSLSWTIVRPWNGMCQP
jgi:hypothetical protein